VFREKRDILEVQHLGRAVAASRRNNLHDIKTERARLFTQTAKVRGDRAPQDIFFTAIDRVIPRHQRTAGPRLHLDEDEDLAIARHEVNFLPPVFRVAPVPGRDAEAPFPFEPLSRRRFRHRTRVPCPARLGREETAQEGEHGGHRHQSAAGPRL